MRWVLSLLCVAACSETGVDLEIHSEVPIETIEIFVGSFHCTDRDEVLDVETPCRNELAWLDGQRPVAGELFETYREDGDKNQLEFRLMPEASKDGSRYTIRLVAEGQLATPKMIAIVGLDGAGQARSLAVIKDAIPQHTAEHWIVTLQAIDLADHDLKPPPEPARKRAAVWGRDGSDEEQASSRCLVMQEWVGSEWKSKFIVPASDHDCDGVAPEVECDTQYYHRNTSLEASCVARRLDPASPCVLGVSTCRDGTDDEDTCFIPDRASSLSPPQTCVPDKLCELCDGPFGVKSCIDVALESSGVSHVTCRFYADASTGVACGPSRPGSKASMQLPFSCAGYTARRLATPLVSLSTMKDFTLAQSTAQFNGSIISSGDSCTITLFFDGGTVVNGSSEWILLGITPFFASPDLMLVPLRIVFDANGTDCDGGGEETSICDAPGFAQDNISNCGV